MMQIFLRCQLEGQSQALNIKLIKKTATEYELTNDNHFWRLWDGKTEEVEELADLRCCNP